MKIDNLQEPLIPKIGNLLSAKLKGAVSNWIEDIIKTELESQKGNEKLTIKYYEEEKLIPQMVQVSGRYVAILFDPENGRQQIHVLHRFSHKMVCKYEIPNTVRHFFLYDPLDIQHEHNRQDPYAYVVTQLNNTSENDPCYVKLFKVSNDNFAMEAAFNGKPSAIAMSPDLEYVVNIYYKWEPKEDHNGIDTFATFNFVFYSTVGSQLKKISTYSCSHNWVAYQEPDQIASAIFIKNEPRAIVNLPSKGVILVDIQTGTALSEFNIVSPVTFYYHMDKQKYYMYSLKTSSEYKLTIKQDSLYVNEVRKPVAFFDHTKTGGFCSADSAYKYGNRQMCASYNKEGLCGFIIDQTFFNIHLKDIKFSRATYLPGCKAFYAVKSVEPFETYVLDLHNLDIQFAASITNDKKLFVGVQQVDHQTKLVIDDVSYVGLEDFDIYDRIVPFSQYMERTVPQLGSMNVRSFRFFDDLLVLRDSYTIRILDMTKKKEIFSHTGLDLQLSDDKTAFIFNHGGMNYSYWKFNQDQQVFVKTIPAFYYSVQRMDFLPGSNNKLIIFDEISNSIIELDTDTQQVIKHLTKCTFTSGDYHIVSDEIISYPESVFQGKNSKVITHIYNIRGQFPDMSYQEKLLMAKQSYDKKYLYVSTQSCVKIYHYDNLHTEIQQFPIANVTDIIETKDITFLLTKKDNANKVYGVSTIQPHLARFFSSGKILQRYIFDVLNNPETQITEAYRAVVAYSQFHERGMVDTYHGIDGHTMIHYLISHQPSSVLKMWFDSGKGTQHYIRRGLDNSSPLKFAYSQNKTSHLAVMLEYYNEHPDQIQIDEEDFKFLMTSPLVAAHIFITNLFTEPKLYKCMLPFSERTEMDLFVTQVPYYSIGSSKSKELAQCLHSDDGEDRILSYCISKFRYNFERGSTSSLEFLEAYSEHESEEVVRSMLRLIIERKFNECLPVLKLQAALFFLLLLILLFKIVYFPENLMLTGTILVFNSLFFGYEMVQLKLSGASEYFESIWNFADLLGFIMLYCVAIAEFFLVNEEKVILSFPTALCFLLLLLRGMSYLRIFSNLRYLINMVVEIMKDMSSFMTLLVYWIIGASLVFYLFVGRPEDPEAAEEYDKKSALVLFTEQLLLTYRLAFGDFSVDDYNAFQWIIFLITSLFIPLVMFNLLIAIMGDTYGRVQEQSVAVDLKQKAELICEIEGLMYWKRNAGEEKKDYLLICYDQSMGEDAIESNQWEGKVKELQKSVAKIESKLNKFSHMKKEIVDALSKEIKSSLAKK